MVGQVFWQRRKGFKSETMRHVSFPTKTALERDPTPESSDSDVFASFRFRGTAMKCNQRFKRVAKPRLPVQTTEPVRRSLRTKPNPSPQPDISPGKMKTLTLDFFQIDALDLAPRLLGKFLRRDDVVLRITEVFFSHYDAFDFVVFLCINDLTPDRLKRIDQTTPLVTVALALLQELPLL